MAYGSENHIDTEEEKEMEDVLWHAMHEKDCIKYLNSRGYKVHKEV